MRDSPEPSPLAGDWSRSSSGCMGCRASALLMALLVLVLPVGPGSAAAREACVAGRYKDMPSTATVVVLGLETRRSARWYARAGGGP